MHISTRTTFGKGRRIERAAKFLTAQWWSFNGGSAYYSPPVPYLSVELDGQDGKTYIVSLDQHDIATLNEALATAKIEHSEAFPPLVLERRR